MNTVLNTVRQAGNGAAQIDLSNDADDELTLVGKRVGNHLIWQVSRQNEKARLDREKSIGVGMGRNRFLRNWSAGLFSKTQKGACITPTT